MRITCPHCGATRVTLLLNRGRDEHGIMVEHLVPDISTIKTVTDGQFGPLQLEVRPSCAWSNALVRVL